MYGSSLLWRTLHCSSRYLSNIKRCSRPSGSIRIIINIDAWNVLKTKNQLNCPKYLEGTEEKGTSVQSMPIPEMNGQKVLVTGAGAGIGRGLTKSLLEMGAEVGILNHVTRNSCDSILLLELPCSFICSLITIFTPSCAPAQPYIV